ncbi:hypothetical protein BO79DRAFT_254161 [Aspergillus costaricaensis CBS 115574]|uniref:Uncharacterized protein n=1 Tax=Aspergillus costaricaensis CBS 115574 TaxID=1448317 RepID=A0ACD1IFS6_9EURO|nr:hypothetical protein BO79DRAFT_254161 [Aspergillus costaricaensis CBS 115574]RAK89421.1 hypothetical protein BO79DRAFT_254161 [Aspergillus costaricaensis CBS 115574]
MKSNMPVYQPLKPNHQFSPKPTFNYASTKGSLLDDDVWELFRALLLLAPLAIGSFWSCPDFHKPNRIVYDYVDVGPLLVALPEREVYIELVFKLAWDCAM